MICISKLNNSKLSTEETLILTYVQYSVFVDINLQMISAQVNAEENDNKTNSFKASIMNILTENQEVPDKNKSMEVVVVGGGVSGLSTAWT